MSRYRLLPTPAQEAVLRDHCAHARFTWNLAVEQHAHWRPGRANAPGYLEQSRQLTQARAVYAWLAAGSQMVQQQALRDFGQAVAAFFESHNPARRPTWRKAGCPAYEPRTSTAAPIGVAVGIPTLRGGEDVKTERLRVGGPGVARSGTVATKALL